MEKMITKFFSWENLAKTALYGLIFLAPLFFLPWGVSPVAFNKQFLIVILTMIAFFGYLGKSLNEGKILYKKGNFLILGFLAALILSLFFSLNLNVSLFGGNGLETDSVINLISFILFFLLTAAVFEKTDVKKIIITYLASVALLLIYQFLQLFGVFILPFNFTKSINFNLVSTIYDLAMFFGANLILILSLLFNPFIQISKMSKWILSIIGLGLFVYILLINYSFVWLILTVSMIVLLILKLRYREEGNLKTGEQNILIVILTIFVFLSFSNLNLGRFVSYFQFNFDPLISLSQSQSIKIIKESANIKNIIVGSGPATFERQYLLHKPIELNSDIFIGLQRITDFWKIRFNTASSLILNYFVSLGGLATILFLIFVLSFILHSFKNYFLPIFIYLTSSFLFYNPSYLLTLLFFGIAGAYKAAEAEKKEIDLFITPQRTFLLSLIIIVFMVGSVFAFYYESQRFAASIYYDLALKKAVAGNFDETIQKLIRAANLDQKSDQYYRDLSQIFLNKLNSPSAAIADVQNAINSAQTAISINPIESRNYLSLAKTYETILVLTSSNKEEAEKQKENINNAYQSALDNYKKAASFDPKNPEIHLNIAQLHLYLNNLDETEKSLKISLDLKPDYSNAYFMLSQVFDVSGKIKEAIVNANTAKLLSPNDIGILFQLGNLYYKDNQLDLAQSELETAIILFPNHSNSLYMLGLVYDKKSLKNKAIEQFEKIVSLNPDNEPVKKILENLRAGKSALEQ